MKKGIPYIFVAALFLIMASGRLFTRGMFIDGLMYCAIAENLAQGIGSVWHLTLSPTCFPNFYEHPPLMMYLLGLWMRLTGGGWVAAKAYGIITYVIEAVILVRLWNAAGGRREMGWLPLLMWLLIPPVTLHSGNLLLESTMLIFTLGAALCMLHKGREWLWHAVAGLLLAAAFLTKGFPGLFPLVIPFVLWLFRLRERSFWRMIGLTAEVFACMVLPIALICWANADAAHHLYTYFGHQVMRGVKVVVVDSRWHIVVVFFKHTALAWGFALITIVVSALRKADIRALPWRTAGAMLAVALCGIVPMMISTKQHDYYCLTAYPFAALSFGMVAAPLLGKMEAWMRSKAGGYVCGIMVVAAVVLGVANFGRFGREKVLQRDMHRILPMLDEGERLGVSKAMNRDLSLKTYYYIEKHVVVDTYPLHRHLLAEGTQPPRVGYREVPLGTEHYHLFERID